MAPDRATMILTEWLEARVSETDLAEVTLHVTYRTAEIAVASLPKSCHVTTHAWAGVGNPLATQQTQQPKELFDNNKFVDF